MLWRWKQQQAEMNNTEEDSETTIIQVIQRPNKYLIKNPSSNANPSYQLQQPTCPSCNTVCDIAQTRLCFACAKWLCYGCVTKHSWHVFACYDCCKIACTLCNNGTFEVSEICKSCQVAKSAPKKMKAAATGSGSTPRSRTPSPRPKRTLSSSSTPLKKRFRCMYAAPLPKKRRRYLFNPAEGNDQWDVERILGVYRISNGKQSALRFLVKWAGWDKRYNQWVEEEDLFCPDLLREYKQKHPKLLL